MKTQLCLLLTKNMFNQAPAWSHVYGRLTASISGAPGSIEGDGYA